jgi:hypothetical protein
MDGLAPEERNIHSNDCRIELVCADRQGRS